MPRIFAYKMICKNHGAPTVQMDKNGIPLLSLAICKPQIRKAAKIGDIIFGFGSKKGKNNGELVYVCEVTETVEAPYYYVLDKYFYRRDCIYRIEENKALQVKGFIMGTPILKDVSNNLDKFPHSVNIGTNYKKSRVILSTNFKTFFKDRSSIPIMSIFSTISSYMQKRARGISFSIINPLLENLWKFLNDTHIPYEEDPIV